MSQLALGRIDLRSLQPDYSSVAATNSRTVGSVGAELMKKAIQPHDISQTGARRLALDSCLCQNMSETVVGYHQAGEGFFADCSDYFALFRSVTSYKEPTRLSPEEVGKLQKALIPATILGEEGEAKVMEEAKAKMLVLREADTAKVVAFLNAKVPESAALQVMVGKADADSGESVVGVKGSGEFNAVTAGAVGMASLQDLYQYTAAVSSMEGAPLQSLDRLIALKTEATNPSNAKLVEPFASAITSANESARLKGTEKCEEIDKKMDEAMSVVEKRCSVTGIYISQLAESVRAAVADAHEVSEEDYQSYVAAGRPAASFLHDDGKHTDFRIKRDADIVAAVLDAAGTSMVEDAMDVLIFNAPVTAAQAGIPLDRDTHRMLGSVSYAMGEMGLVSMEGMNDAAHVAFGITRTHNRERGLLCDSDEVSSDYSDLHGALTLQKYHLLLDHIVGGVRANVLSVCSVISFLKSGHHAGSAGLAVVLNSILASLGPDMVYDIDDLAPVMAAGVYYGAHPASMRMAAYMYHRMSANGELGYAISRRLRPEGPSVVSVTLLAKIMAQLHDAKFFAVTGRLDSYTRFMQAYDNYMVTAWKETPYAGYLYGVSKEEDVGFKALTAKFAAYAVAVEEIMPDSTISLSVALKRDAKAAANNSIVAALEVSGFVSAYKRYVKQMASQGLVATLPNVVRGGMSADLATG